MSKLLSFSVSSLLYVLSLRTTLPDETINFWSHDNSDKVTMLKYERSKRKKVGNLVVITALWRQQHEDKRRRNQTKVLKSTILRTQPGTSFKKTMLCPGNYIYVLSCEFVNSQLVNKIFNVFVFCQNIWYCSKMSTCSDSTHKKLNLTLINS